MKRLVRIPVLALSLAFVSCRDSSGPEGIDIFGCKQGMEYTIGQTVNGSIRSSDCGSASEGFGDFYRIRLTNAGPVSISVQTTNSSDPLFVILVDASDELVDLAGTEPGAPAADGGQLEAGAY